MPAAAGRQPDFDVVSALWALAPEAAVYTLAQVVIFLPCLLLVRTAWPNHKDVWGLADLLFSVGLFPVLTASAMLASWRLSGNVGLRWHGVLPESQFFMMLYTTRAALHCFVQYGQLRCGTLGRSHFCLMTLHHILSMVCYSGGLVLQSMHFWGCILGCCEMSTVFLNNLYLMKEATPGGREIKEFVPSWFYAVNGLFLWLSFLVFRIVLFPSWLYAWYQDVTTSPETTWETATAIERYLYPAVTLFLLVLSVYWFIPVTKGLIKVVVGLFGGKGGDKKTKAS